MKTKISMISTIAVMMTCLSFVAMADDQPQAVGQSSEQQSAQPQGTQQRHQEHFERLKKKLTRHLQAEIDKKQERLDCIQKAEDSKALHACLHMHKRHKEDEKH